MELIIYYLFLPTILALSLIIAGLFFYKYVIYYNRTHKKYFQDKKVQKFCWYIRRGKIDKLKQLLDEGVDINTKGSNGLTPLIWLIYYNFKTKKILRSLKFLLENGADPFVEFEKMYDYNFVQLASAIKSPEYLKIFLEVYKPTVRELDKHKNSYNSPAITQTIFYDRLIQFKMLLGYGVNVNFKNSITGRNILNNNGHHWKYAYRLLKAGADWSNVSKSHRKSESVKPEDRNRPDYLCFIESIKHPSYVVAKNKGVDYFQKVVSFLRKHGAKFKLNLDPKEKYQKINGEEVLFFKEDGKWQEYTKTKQYKKDLKTFRPSILERIAEKINQF